MRLEEFSQFFKALCLSIPKFAPDPRDKEVVQIWHRQFKDYDINEMMDVLNLCTEKFDEFPSMKKLKTLLNAGMTSENEIGEDVAARIEYAIGAYGYTNPDQARNYIGSLGWEVVRQLGGWDRICEVRTDELMSARRQWREFAKVLHQKQISGNMRRGPELPSSVNDQTKKLGLDLSFLPVRKGNRND